MKLLTMFLLLVALSTTALAREARRDSSTGRIRFLYIGDAWGETPYFYMTTEPSLVGTPVPASLSHAATYESGQLRQFMRIYMPRRYEDFAAHFDLPILSDASADLFTLEQLNWFKRGVEEEGMGMMMVGGVESFGGWPPYSPSWAGSPVEDALPVLCIDGAGTYRHFSVVAGSGNDAFISSLPWSTMPSFHGMNIVTPKEGSAVLLSASLENRPVLVYWEFGKGCGLAQASDWSGTWGESVMEWAYYADYVANMNYLNAGVEIPQNPVLMHQIRRIFVAYGLNRAEALSLLEFIERFGVRASLGEDRLEQISETHREAQAAFIEQQYDECMDLLAGIEEDFTQLSEDLVELKDRALFWIYVMEWLAVSGTTIACGAVLWTVMVRRRLYREITTTRAQHRSEDS